MDNAGQCWEEWTRMNKNLQGSRNMTRMDKKLSGKTGKDMVCCNLGKYWRKKL